MKRAIEEDYNTTTTMANYLMLLSRGTNFNATTNSHNRVFECKTCNRRFTSFQALGGHRASHKRPRLTGTDLNLGNQSETEPATKPKLHECSVCGLKFAIGQALGGHMRRHKAGLGEVAMGKVQKSRRVLCLDLNLTPYENDLKFDYCL